MDADRVLRELCLLGFSNMADFLIPHDDGTASFDFSALRLSTKTMGTSG